MEKPQGFPIRGLTPKGSDPSLFLGRDREARPLVVRLERLERQDPLQRADAPRAELRARRRSELVQSLCSRPGRAVDPRRQHGVERVGDVDDSRPERNVLAGEPIGLAGAVEAIAVVPHRRHRVVEEADTVADSDSIAAVERSFSSLFAISSDTFWDWIVSAASRSFCALRCVCFRYASCVLRISSRGTAKTASASRLTASYASAITPPMKP